MSNTKTIHLNQDTFAEQYPDAFDALPECYQADSCLRFWVENNQFYSAPLESEEYCLGIWVSIFEPEHGWIDYSHNGKVVYNP